MALRRSILPYVGGNDDSSEKVCLDKFRASSRGNTEEASVSRHDWA
jgi:hypothetical protein